MPACAHIVAFGARTAVGLTPETSAAAIRTGVSRAVEHPYLVNVRGEPLRAAYDRRLDEQLPALDRMLALSEHCLGQLAERLVLPPQVELPLLLALPETRPGFSDADAATLERRLAHVERGPRMRSISTVARGHAGALQALQMAAQLVARSTEGACFVGGVDSYLEPATLAWLSRHGQVAQPDARSAFCPGEGACFALVVSTGALRQLGVPSLATICGAAVATETRRIKTDEDNLGHGLTEAVTLACRDTGGLNGPIDAVYSDINGERYRTEEWGLAILRRASWFRDPAGYTAPADRWGDIGAATGTCLAMLAAAAWQRGHAKGPRSMLIAGSEAGLRAAVILQQPPNPPPRSNTHG